MRPLLAVVASASIGLGLPGLAAADPDPVTPRVLTAPTAWLPPAGAVVGTGTLDHRFDGSVVVGVGLGGIAALDLGTDTDVRGCTTCDGDATPLYLGRATFRMGARQDALFRGMPAVLVGARTTFATSGSGFGRVRVSEAYAVASRMLAHDRLGKLRLHAGVLAIDASMNDDSLGPTLRPAGGFEYTPPQYPQTTLMGDLSYVPLLRDTATPGGDPVALEWIAGWGVRYQAFEWGAIELALRHREGEGLGDSTVMVRVQGVFLPSHVREATKKVTPRR
jgi:hypothetical protein